MSGPTNAELSAKVDELQVALDEEQQQVADLLAEKNSTIETLNGVIVDLEGQIADGGTAEQRQALLDKMNALLSDLKGTVADASQSGE
jgi:hypothetical protein